MRAIAISIAALVAAARPGAAAELHGRVFADVDGDGRYSAGDHPVAGAWVWFETATRARTGADGRFVLRPGGKAKSGIVWVRVPEGFAPGPAWRPVELAEDGPAADLELPLVPVHLDLPLTFVHVSDAHIGKAGLGGGALSAADLSDALEQALDLEPPPAFVVMTGDLTNREKPSEIAAAAGVLLHLPVPFVPVPGNHDWVEGGVEYRRTFGPPSYSFDAGGVHFVVLNDNWHRPPDLEFLARELETVESDREIIAFVHRPPRDRYLARLAALGVDHLFTGHWHSNRYVDLGGLREINTEALIRGGIDFTPAGYRIVSVKDGELTIVHRTVVEGGRAAFTWPPAAGCVAATGDLEVLAAVELGAAEPDVRLAVDGGETTPMKRRGGWVFAAPAPLAPGRHRLSLEVSRRGAPAAEATREVSVCREPPPPPAIGSWPQSQNGPGHTGVAGAAIAPPLRGVWATAVGGHVLGGSPAVGGGLVVVGVSDLADGDGGGAVALDARTGAVRWRYVTGHSVRGTPAIAGDTVIVGAADGTLHALDLESGARRWVVDLGAGVDDNRSALIAAPSVAGGVVYAGVAGRLAAIDVDSGEVLWEDRHYAAKAKDMTSRAAPGVGGGRVIATAGFGTSGWVALDAAGGQPAWRLPRRASEGANASPLIANGRAYLLNARGELRQVDVASGKVDWKLGLVEGANTLSLSTAAAPALGGDILVVPTQYESLIAVDVRRRGVAWRRQVGLGVVHTAHDQRTARSVPGSPVIAGNIVWFGDATGLLHAVALESGDELWSTDVGAPILAGPAAAGELLVVASFDGTVRGLARDETRPAIRPPLPRAAPGLLLAALLGAVGLGTFAAMRMKGGAA